MKATVHSRCECQATLSADLDETHKVIEGWAFDSRKKKKLNAPAQNLGGDSANGEHVFQVAWNCPCCTRNTLRMFHTEALAFA